MRRRNSTRCRSERGAAFDDYFAGGGLEQAIDQAQSGSFARATAAQKNERFAGLNCEVEFFENRRADNGRKLDLAKFDGDAVGSGCGHGGEANNPLRTVSNFCYVP